MDQLCIVLLLIVLQMEKQEVPNLIYAQMKPNLVILMHQVHLLFIVLEYRSSSKGFFTFQTFVNLNSGFLSSFSNLKEGQNITMSYCNFVDNTLSYISEFDQDSSIIYVRRCSVFLKSFCFLRIKVENPNKFSIVHFSGGKQNNNEATLSNSIIDNNI